MLTREWIERRTAILAEIDKIPLEQSDEFDRATAELRAIEQQLRFAEERYAADRRALGVPVTAAAAAVECRAFAGVRSPLPPEFRGDLWRARDGMAGAAHKIAVDSGILTADEVRETEGFNPRGDGAGVA